MEYTICCFLKYAKWNKVIPFLFHPLFLVCFYSGLAFFPLPALACDRNSMCASPPFDMEHSERFHCTAKQKGIWTAFKGSPSSDAHCLAYMTTVHSDVHAMCMQTPIKSPAAHVNTHWTISRLQITYFTYLCWYAQHYENILPGAMIKH